MKRFFRPLVLLLLAGMVALSPLCALAQEVAAEEEAPITHTAIASVALKVRRSPSKDASAGDSIPRDSWFNLRVSIPILFISLECDAASAHHRMEGYVLTQYLDDITLYDLEAAEANGTADLEIDVAEPINAPNFTTSPENFHEALLCLCGQERRHLSGAQRAQPQDRQRAHL